MDPNTDRYQSVDPEELLRYHRGEMSHKEMNALERAAIDDPFLADALEGWENEDDLSLLDEVGRPESALSSASGMGVWRPLLIVAGVAVMVFAIYRTQQNISEMKRMKAELESKFSPAEQPYIVSPAQDSIDEMEIELSTELPVAEQIIPERIIDETPPLSEEVSRSAVEEATPQAEREREQTEPEAIEPRPETTIEVEPPLKERKEREYPIYYVEDLKVADYREERADREQYISMWSHTSTSTPADRESAGEEKTEGGFKVVEIAYVDYLDQAMESFSNERYKEALRMYRVILKQFPDDVNAYFYGGLAYYNLDRQKKASTYLSRAQFHPSRVFDEEAEYYRALSLLHAEKGQEADFILRNIQRRNGFYAKKAEVLLDR